SLLTTPHATSSYTLSLHDALPIYALVFLSSPDEKTVPVGVTSELIRGDVFFWGPLMAGALLGSIPVAIIYSFFVENYVAGKRVRSEEHTSELQSRGQLVCRLLLEK